MIARLSQLSEEAEPSTFHHFLRVLDNRCCLLRVYTQNIDALEEKLGLTFGVPHLDLKWAEPWSRKGKLPVTGMPRPHEPSANRLSPPVGTPKCIPLHGTLQLMHCMRCAHSCPLHNHIDSLVTGMPPPCPQCITLEEMRQLVRKRPRSVGKLRPNIVLYNEDHEYGEEVGSVVWRDLMQSSKDKGRAGADLLLVVGTSLRVPGMKRIVREFSKAVRSWHTAMKTPPNTLAGKPTISAHNLRMPTSCSHPSSETHEELPVRTIYLNLNFPVLTRGWEDVFDVWVRGDAQAFARMVHEELEEEKQAKEGAKERKRKRG